MNAVDNVLTGMVELFYEISFNDASLARFVMRKFRILIDWLFGWQELAMTVGCSLKSSNKRSALIIAVVSWGRRTQRKNSTMTGPKKRR